MRHGEGVLGEAKIMCIGLWLCRMWIFQEKQAISNDKAWHVGGFNVTPTPTSQCEARMGGRGGGQILMDL